jgi:hypothetical protein
MLNFAGRYFKDQVNGRWWLVTFVASHRLRKLNQANKKISVNNNAFEKNSCIKVSLHQPFFRYYGSTFFVRSQAAEAAKPQSLFG